MASSGRFIVANVSRGTVLAEKSKQAATPVSRAFGLMGKRSLPAGEGLIIRPCSSVTCFFMRFPIDVAFVGDGGQILHLIHAMMPWRVSRFVRGSKYVVELPAGTLERTNTHAGDTLEVRPAG